MIDLWRNWYSKLSRKVLRDNRIRHSMPSLVYSPEDLVTNEFLIGLAADAIRRAWSDKIDIPDGSLPDHVYYNVFPGEHYRLLKAIAAILKPAVAVEVGTSTGMGSVALKQGLAEGKLYTVDIAPWHSFKTHLTQADFDNGRVEQRLADLSQREAFEQFRPVLEDAAIIFMDAPKDGRFEYVFMDLLSGLQPKAQKLLILDDIRFVNMIDLWRSITSPKLDLSSFGHWSGTGLVDISEGLKMRG